MSRLVEGGILTILFFLVVNVVFLNVYFISKQSSNTAVTTVVSAKSEDSNICDDLCQEQISQKILSKTSPVPEKKVDTQKTQTHEYIIPLGSGTTTSKEFESIDGSEITIDTNLYPGIKKIMFETYMSIPTANGIAYAKLFNVTDKHDVWYSDQSMETNIITFRESPISLDQGKKTYKLMMKSTMGYEAKVYNARIRIITE